jgi:hypothetical protein
MRKVRLAATAMRDQARSSVAQGERGGIEDMICEFSHKLLKETVRTLAGRW